MCWKVQFVQNFLIDQFIINKYAYISWEKILSMFLQKRLTSYTYVKYY